MKNRGFTLVELMIAIAVIAILAAISIPNFMSYRDVAHANSCSENMRLIQDACRGVLLRRSVIETDLTKLCDTTHGPPYLKGIPKCPIQGSYTITYDADRGEFHVTCSKADNEDHKVGD